MRIRRLRCRFSRGCRRRDGRQLSIGPHRTVFEILFLPDGNGAFESVDGVAAGIEGGGAVSGAYGDEDAGFADFEAAQAVDYGYAMMANFS